MGFKKMQHLTHDMENVFSEIRNDTIKVNSNPIDILFDCLDAIEAYVDTIKQTSNEGDEDNAALIKRLNDFLADGKDAGDGSGEPAPSEDAKAEEQAKEEAADAKDAYRQIRLEENDIKTLEENQSSGMNLYGFTVHVQKECMLKAARAFLVYKAVEDFGEILIYSPSSQDIEDEKFDLAFSFILASPQELDPIKKAVENVSEIESVDCDKVTPDMFKIPDASAETEAAPAEAPKEEAKAPAAAPAAKAPAKKDAKKKQTVNKPVTARTVRVDIEKLDALMNQVSELIIAKNSLVALSAQETASNGQDQGTRQTFQEQIEYLERITTTLHESVMKVRMVPIENTVNKFPRMIRDLSRRLKKPMELVMTGEDTELDRTVVDQIGDPLQHLLRNSADHGIEAPEVRRAAGKPETGQIFLNAYQEGNNVIIQVGDDGAGIDTEAVKQKAIERGLVSEEDAENLTKKDIIDFLFMPSFSMSQDVV